MFNKLSNKIKISLSFILISLSLYLTLPIWNGLGCNALFSYENKNFIGYGYCKRGHVEVFITENNKKNIVITTHIDAQLMTYKNNNILYFNDITTNSHSTSKKILLNISMLKYNQFYVFKDIPLPNDQLILIDEKYPDIYLTIKEGKLSFF